MSPPDTEQSLRAEWDSLSAEDQQLRKPEFKQRKAALRQAPQVPPRMAAAMASKPAPAPAAPAPPELAYGDMVSAADIGMGTPAEMAPQESAAPEQIAAAEVRAPEHPTAPLWRSAVRGGLDYATAGFADEAAAGIDVLTGQTDKSWRERQKEYEAAYANDEAANPGIYHGAGLVTSLAVPGPKAKSIPGKIAVGAGYGGASGIGHSRANLIGEGAQPSRVAEEGLGGAFGGAVAAGAVAPLTRTAERLAGPRPTPANEPGIPPRMAAAQASRPESARLVERIRTEAGEGREGAELMSRADKNVRSKMMNTFGEITGDRALENSRAESVLLAPERRPLLEVLTKHGGDQRPYEALQAVEAQLEKESQAWENVDNIRVTDVQGIDRALDGLKLRGNQSRNVAIDNARAALHAEFGWKGPGKQPAFNPDKTPKWGTENALPAPATAMELKRFSQDIASAAFPQNPILKTADQKTAADIRGVIIDAINRQAEQTPGIDAQKFAEANRAYAVLSSLRENYMSRLKNERDNVQKPLRGILQKTVEAAKHPGMTARETGASITRAADQAINQRMAIREAEGRGGIPGAATAADVLQRSERTGAVVAGEGVSKMSAAIRGRQREEQRRKAMRP